MTSSSVTDAMHVCIESNTWTMRRPPWIKRCTRSSRLVSAEHVCSSRSKFSQFSEDNT
jgi:hypothetical protein